MIVAAAIAAWAVLAGVIAIVAVHWATRRKHELRRRAYEELLREKGIEKKPDESIKSALLRARRAERSDPPRPLPDFARSVLQRPASRPDFTAHDTRHVGGHTAASNPGFKAPEVPRPRPRAGLILPPFDPHHRKG